MRRGNITSGFEDNIVLSNTFLDKYAEEEEQVLELSLEDKLSAISGILEEVSANYDDFSKENIINAISTILSGNSEKSANDYSDETRTKFVDILGKLQGSVEYIIEHISSLEKDQIVEELKSALTTSREWTASKRIASKDELIKLGFTSQGTGIYKDADHHLWNLSREGEGYAISRVAEEEDILKDKKIATKEIAASQVTITNEASLGTFFSNLDQSGVYYNNVAEDISDTGYSAVVDVSDEDMGEFTAIAQESGVRTAAKDCKEEENYKVFSDEAVLTGISHYSTMGYDTKEAIKNFIESNQLDSKHYTPLINEVLARYNY